MCNLYNQTRAVDAMRQLFDRRDLRNDAGNVEPGDIYPDYPAPIIRADGEGLALQTARWGLPSPKEFHSPKGIDKGVTNVRNTGSPHWRRWLGPEHRCLVPFTKFSGPTGRGGPKTWAWFELPEDQPAFFAGIWVGQWTSLRKLKEGEVTADLFAFLTCEPNAEVGTLHPKAMPVILTEPAEWDAWLIEPWAEAKRLQRPLPDGSLTVAVPE